MFVRAYWRFPFDDNSKLYVNIDHMITIHQDADENRFCRADISHGNDLLRVLVSIEDGERLLELRNLQ
jgi:hypothetical protein